MANVENLKKKLLELIEHNNPLAIALTGEWGIGKTHLWKEFYKDNKDNFVTNKKKNLETSMEENFIAKKYAYISLFGLDSLESLKLAIATEVQTSASDDSPLNVDISKHFKKLFGFVGGGSIGASGDMRFGINIGNKLITNIIMSHLKDTLICLDDIERKSDSLPMSEIMGLVNYLKNERNCQVLMIMHDEESDDKDYFNKHKEKVFDEVLILDESLSIIKDKISDIETFPIYEKFYQTMSIKNLRFYQRVQKTYQQIVDSSSILSNLSREEILKQILIVKLAIDMPTTLKGDLAFVKAHFSDRNIDERIDIFYGNDEELKKATKIEVETMRKKLHKFYPHFRFKPWTEVIIELINNINIDTRTVENLNIQDTIKGDKLATDRTLRALLTEYYSLDPQLEFNQRLFSSAKNVINSERLNNLSFYHNILKQNEAYDLADQLEKTIKEHISSKISESADFRTIRKWYISNIEENDIFYKFLKSQIDAYYVKLENNMSTSQLCHYFKNYFYNMDCDFQVAKVISKINKSQLKEIMWFELPDETDRKKYILEILKHPTFKISIPNLSKLIFTKYILSNASVTDNRTYKYSLKKSDIFEQKFDQIRRWMLEILQQQVVQNTSSKAPIMMWLKYTKDLTDNLYAD